MKRYTLLPVLLLLLKISADAQEYSYTHYDNKDGLAGSTVHGITQDADGFMWFATETGLSRFDGARFKNYTQNDGLPSNDVFTIRLDRQDRIWITSYAPAICYYWRGKIYNQQNDPTLRQVHLPSWNREIAECKDGTILLHSDPGILLKLDMQAHTCRTTGRPSLNELYRTSSFPVSQASIPPGWLQTLQPEDSVRDKKEKLIPGNPVIYYPNVDLRPDSDYILMRFLHKALIISKKTGRSIALDYDNKNMIMNLLGKDKVSVNTITATAGTRIYDCASGKLLYTFLPDYTVHLVYQDREGNFWCSTKTSGIFRISNPSFKNNSFGDLKVPLVAKDIRKIGDRIYVGTTGPFWWELIPEHDSTGKGDTWYIPRKSRSNFSLLKYDSSHSLIGCFSADFLNFPKVYSVKTAFSMGDSLLVATVTETLIASTKTGNALRSIYKQRTLCAIRLKNNYYLGTLNGLYCYDGKKTYALGDSIPRLRSRTTFLALGANDMLWIATDDQGVIGYRNGRVVEHITMQNGLSSNICRCIFVAGATLWIGTDKGLNKAERTAKGYLVTEKFNTNDGLGSDIINTVFVDHSMVYVGTPAGLTYFDDTKVARHAVCDIHLTGITVSGKVRDPFSNNLLLPHKSNNIRFEFAGLSFLSGSDMTYKYRLLGLGDEWQSTREPVLNYPSLPSGSYTLQLIAVNKFNDQSKVLQYSFEIQKTIWEKVWFQLGMAGLLALAGALAGRYSIQRSRRKEKEKLAFNQRLLELEQMALRAQMNPHFIFNCLNSMQQYILRNDARSANFYLSRFAGLVRQTLDNSPKVYLTLAEEIAYLKDYIELERLQMTNAFTVNIHIASSLDPDKIKIPNMVLQPYVENAVKHGLGALESGGMLQLIFRPAAAPHTLECVIEDNGPGIHSGRSHMQHPATGHHSKGIAITSNRIQTLNQMNHGHKNIQVWIEDLAKTHPSLSGTRVTVLFPQ